MKNILPVLFLALLFTTSCSNIIEKQLDIYSDAIEELDDVDDFNVLMNKILDTETRISLTTANDEEEEELKEEYEESYELMIDSVETMRKEYYSKADKLFLGYTYNFIERRILLYEMAADRYCKAEYIEEINAIKELTKRYSQLSFVESQRSCDPPAVIREKYEATKNLAENCFDLAKKRIADKDSEEDLRK
jgi:hypothetical protein